MLREEGLLPVMLEGSMEGRMKRGWRRIKVIDDLTGNNSYQITKDLERQRSKWRQHWCHGSA